MAKKGRAVVVEGYTDVIAAHAAGVGETVAVMGTAITPDQVKLLAAHTGEVVLALDADRAGREAMLRAQGVAAGKKVRLRVAAMPEGEDPADMLGGEGPGSSRGGEVRAAGGGGGGSVGLPRGDAPGRCGSGYSGRARSGAGRGCAGAEGDGGFDYARRADARGWREAGRRSRVGGAAAGRGAEGSAAGCRFPNPRSAGGGEESPFVPSDSGTGAPRALSTQERREAGLLQMCIAAPAYGRDYIEKLKKEHLSTPTMARVRDWLAAHLDEPVKGLPEDDAELSQIVRRLAERAADEPASPEAMELNFLQLEQGAIERRIAEAAAAGATEASVELQKRRSALTEKIAHHQSTTPKQPARG